MPNIPGLKSFDCSIYRSEEPAGRGSPKNLQSESTSTDLADIYFFLTEFYVRDGLKLL